MGITLTQKLFIGLVTLNVVAIFLFAYLLLSTFKENEFTSPTEAVARTRETEIPFCEAHQSLSHDIRHNCSLLNGLQLEDYVSSGWTKVVYRSKIQSIPVAVKSVNIKGKDITDCKKHTPALECYNNAVEKLGTEIDLLRKLTDESIIKLYYYCYNKEGEPGCLKHALVATELGDPLSNIKLLQMSWKKRRLIIQDLAGLIHYAENSPIGSLRIADLRRPQFVLLKGRLKLVDLDDIFVGEPRCSSDADCSDLNMTIPCISNQCAGYNVKLNIQKSYKEFAPYIFLLDDVPETKRTKLEELRQSWLGNNVTTEQLYRLAELL